MPVRMIGIPVPGAGAVVDAINYNPDRTKLTLTTLAANVLLLFTGNVFTVEKSFPVYGALGVATSSPSYLYLTGESAKGPYSIWNIAALPEYLYVLEELPKGIPDDEPTEAPGMTEPEEPEKIRGWGPFRW